MRRRLVSLLLIIIDSALVGLIPVVALWLRFDGPIPDLYWLRYLENLPYIVVVQIGVFWALGLYRRLWQYASIHEMLLITAAVTIGSVALLLVGLVMQQMLPRSTYLISWVFNIVAIGCSRLTLRVYYYLRNRTATKIDKASINVLIVGAGDAGAVIAREIKNTLGDKKKLVGFIDDSDFKKHQMLFGVPILGTRHDIARVVMEHFVDEIIIAMPSVNGQIIRDITEACRNTGCRVQIVPGLYELIDGEEWFAVCYAAAPVYGFRINRLYWESPFASCTLITFRRKIKFVVRSLVTAKQEETLKKSKFRRFLKI